MLKHTFFPLNDFSLFFTIFWKILVFKKNTDMFLEWRISRVRIAKKLTYIANLLVAYLLFKVCIFY